MGEWGGGLGLGPAGTSTAAQVVASSCYLPYSDCHPRHGAQRAHEAPRTCCLKVPCTLLPEGASYLLPQPHDMPLLPAHRRAARHGPPGQRTDGAVLHPGRHGAPRHAARRGPAHQRQVRGGGGVSGVAERKRDMQKKYRVGWYRGHRGCCVWTFFSLLCVDFLHIQKCMAGGRVCSALSRPVARACVAYPQGRLPHAHAPPVSLSTAAHPPCCCL